MNADGLADIYNYLEIDDSLGSAGQPSPEQFDLIQQAGFDIVINLALPSSDNAIANEGAIVTGHGMRYVHIPVDFESPQPEDYRLFSAVMDGCRDHKVFVHCAANMRVSAFVYLYRTQVLNVPEEEARQDMQVIWTPDETWSDFIRSIDG